MNSFQKEPDESKETTNALAAAFIRRLLSFVGHLYFTS